MATVYWIGTATDGDWNTTSNWSTGSLPVSGDDVIIDRTSDTINLNIDQSAVTLDSLRITSGFTGQIGSVSTASTDEYLQIKVDKSAGDLTIGEGSGNGSRLINIDLSTTACQVNIIRCNATGAESNKPPVRLKMNNSSNVIQIAGSNSTVGLIENPGDSGALGDVTVIDSNLITIGYDATFTSFTQKSGNTVILETSGTLKVSGGTVRTEGTAATTSIIQTGGIVESNSTGTITSYTGISGQLDLSKSSFARTITTLTASPGFTSIRNENITITNDNLDSDYDVFTVSVN